MGFWDDSEEDKAMERAVVQSVITANRLAEEQKRTSTCKVCKKIFSEGYPYQMSMFGKVKNYVCKDCAVNMGLKPREQGIDIQGQQTQIANNNLQIQNQNLKLEVEKLKLQIKKLKLSKK